MKRFLMILALALIFSSSAFAGEMPTGGYAPPPPDPTHITSAPAPGDVPGGDSTQAPTTDITLTAVQAIIVFLSF